MTQSAFTAALEHELEARRVPFDQTELLEFAAGSWPLAAEDPKPVRWADEFLQVVSAAGAQE
jgi:hypothetical protein